VLALDPIFASSNQAECDVFSREIKIPCKPFIAGKLDPSAYVVRIHVKEPHHNERNISYAFNGHLFAMFLLLRY
jgi:hypothetical protein